MYVLNFFGFCFVQSKVAYCSRIQKFHLFTQGYSKFTWGYLKRVANLKTFRFITLVYVSWQGNSIKSAIFIKSKQLYKDYQYSNTKK